MSSKLAKTRKRVTKDELKKDLFEEGETSLPDPIDEPDDNMDKEGDIIGSVKGITDDTGGSKDLMPADAPSSLSTVKPPKSSAELVELNRSAEYILGCLPPGMKKDFEVAAFDNAIDDIGVYILGLLNQAYKVGDYYNPDVEKPWEEKTIGYKGNLTCQFCGKPIVNPKNINQIFCSNLCAKNSNKYPTGIVKPVEKHRPTEEEEDKISYEKELSGQ